MAEPASVTVPLSLVRHATKADALKRRIRLWLEAPGRSFQGWEEVRQGRARMAVFRFAAPDEAQAFARFARDRVARRTEPACA